VPKPSIVFIKFHGQYFPQGPQDVEALNSLNIFSTRIQQSALPYLEELVKKTYRISYVPWTQAYPELIANFQASIKSRCEEPVKFKVESNVVFINFATSELSSVELVVKFLTTFVGRYSIRARREFKAVENSSDRSLCRIVMEYDEEINNSLFYSKQSLPEDPKASVQVVLNLSAACRQVYTLKKSTLSTGKVLTLEFQDRISDEWVTSFTRSFKSEDLSGNELQHLALFFSNIKTKT
jgi:hypothetical protein